MTMVSRSNEFQMIGVVILLCLAIGRHSYNKRNRSLDQVQLQPTPLIPLHRETSNDSVPAGRDTNRYDGAEIDQNLPAYLPPYSKN
jgi:hypothetical protein